MRVLYFRSAKKLYLLVVLAVLLTAGLIIGYFYVSEEKAMDSADVISWAVANKVIIVDPGHGGIDPGAIGPSGTLEKDVNLAISKKLALFLSQAGAVVVMTREDDSSFSRHKRADLDARIALSEEKKADIFLSIQGNALKSSRWTGAQTFFNPKSQESQKLAVAVQKELGRILGNTNRQARPLPEAYILKRLKIPAVVVEVGFLSNPVEERMLNDSHYTSRVAWSIYAGVADYFRGEE